MRFKTAYTVLVREEVDIEHACRATREAEWSFISGSVRNATLQNNVLVSGTVEWPQRHCHSCGKKLPEHVEMVAIGSYAKANWTRHE